MRRSIWFWLCFILSIVLATYFAVRIIMTAMGHGNAARVRTISISADMRGPDLNPVATAAAVAPGTHTYKVDLAALNMRIAATPGVHDTAVRRMPNGNLKVKVKMHHAVAQWTDGTAYFPLSADGTIVKRPTDTRDVSSIVFRGPVPGDISEITKAAHNMTGKLDYLEWIEGRRWNMQTIGGITVMLPEENPAAAIAGLMVLDEKHNLLSRDISVIDMRDEARILVK